MDNTRTLLFMLTAGSLICNRIAAGLMTEKFVDYALGSLQGCILKVKGSTITCCASSNCIEMHLLSATTLETEIKSKDGDKTILNITKKINPKLLDTCVKITWLHMNLKTCQKAKFEEIEGGKGASFCATWNLFVDGVETMQVENNCIDFKSDGSIDFRGRKNDNGAKMALIKFKDAKGLLSLMESVHRV